MSLPLLPRAEIIRPIRPRQRSKALAPPSRLVNLALISAPILIAHDRAELPFIPDVVRIGADHRVLHRLVLRLVLLLLLHEGLLRCVMAKIIHLFHLFHVMLRLLVHQAQHIGRLVHPYWLPIRNLIIFHALRTLRFAETYFKHRFELAFKCAQLRLIAIAEGFSAGIGRDRAKFLCSFLGSVRSAVN